MTKNIISTSFFFLFFNCMFSQGVFFTFGKTITGYDYTNSEGESIDELKRGLGNFFEVGGVFALNRNQHLNYEVGITLSQFNSKATIDRHFYSWETSYIGIQNVINYNFFKFSTFNFSRNNSLLLSDFNLFVKGGLNVSYIIYGEQIVGSRTYDISKNEEFKGFFVQPLMGVGAKIKIVRNIGLSIGYNFSKAINTSRKKEQQLDFYGNQVELKIYFFTKH
ncbi:MAG: hypothetical protein ACI8RY_000144 [Urechidicola sp.]|jgi:hypothetical protein